MNIESLVSKAKQVCDNRAFGEVVHDEPLAFHDLAIVLEHRAEVVPPVPNGIKTAIKAGVDSVEHASFLDDEAIALAKEHGTWLSMDIYNTEYTLSFGEQNGVDEENLNKERLVSKKQRDSFKRAVEAGVNMVFGTDAAIYPHGDNAKQFSRMVEFGMSELQAIQAATINSAKLLKADKQLGQIKTGFAADIIAVNTNPLKNISTLEQIPFVMKAGVVYKQ